MDPYYFLDLEIEYQENSHEYDCELSEFTSMYPNGDWVVGCNDKDFDEYKILYGGEEYTYIHYSHNEGIIYLNSNGNTVKKLKINLSEVP